MGGYNMEILAYRVDENGYIVDTLVVDKDSKVDKDIIILDKPDGLHRAKWTGVEWVEDMSQEEIDALNNQPKETSETDLLMLAVAELDMQRVMDKTEMQIAIAELASTLLGGV